MIMIIKMRRKSKLNEAITWKIMLRYMEVSQDQDNITIKKIYG